MTARETLAENLQALMDSHHTHKSALAIERATDRAGFLLSAHHHKLELFCNSFPFMG